MVNGRDAAPAARQERIVSLLRAMQKELHVDELAKILDVSPLTVRRDLAALADDRAVIRTHGGCLAAGRAALESEFQQKVARNFALKQAIGHAASELVKPGNTILLSDGSTTFHLVTSLAASFASDGRKPRSRVTIYSTSIALIAEVSRRPALSLYLIGGRYDEETHALNGGFAESVLDSLKTDFVFLGADAVDARGRCLVATPEEARLARAMLRCGRRGILLADATKVGAAATFAYGSLKEVQCWITTPGIEPAALRRFRRMTLVKEARP